VLDAEHKLKTLALLMDKKDEGNGFHKKVKKYGTQFPAYKGVSTSSHAT